MHNVVTISEIQPGEQFRWSAIDGTLIDSTEHKVLCLMTTLAGPMPFDASAKADYRSSSLRNWLEHHFLLQDLKVVARKKNHEKE